LKSSSVWGIIEAMKALHRHEEQYGTITAY
jgi:hypothetical protein